jgi:PPOX class probable F420-dependent enzyme
MAEMSKKEISKFLMKGTFTGKLATVREDGNPHVAPIWFVLDRNNSDSKIGNIYLTTGEDSVKGKNIQRNKRVSLSVDDQTPPFSFVLIEGDAKIFPYKHKEVLKWATKIAERYMGKKKAGLYGNTNSGEGSILVQIKPKKIIAEKDITILD